MSDFVVPAKTGYDQRRAADPAVSAWVSANAGSGKTKVLADRVLRLLLAGVDPARILCLTFTKAAAANMANRVFDELGAWVALDDAALSGRLAALAGETPASGRLAQARRLFARAVETPGGLKIETIHAFCERLLHLFPFEANVPARFEVLDEAMSQELLEQATREALITAARAGDPALTQALALISHEAGDEAVGVALRAALRCKTFLREHARGDVLARVLDALGALCGLSPGETPEQLRRRIVEDGLAPQTWPAIAAVLAQGGKTDKDRAEGFRRAHAAADLAERFALYCGLFLTQAGEPAKRLATKAVDPALKERLEAERDRVFALLGGLKAAEAVARTGALFTLADAVFGRVEALKNARGALDFDDLIARTVALLRRADAAWILYKLDAGIDHVLIDEAQDTSPDQWTILRTLAEEFTAGEGAAVRRRTLFAVGDPKQSIYGFQGAAPHAFEASGRYFRTRAQAAGMRFEEVELTVSFRSAPEVLSAVDAVFEVPEHRRGLSFADDAGAPVHESARPSAPGIVEVWETEWKAAAPDADAWALPLDEPEGSAPPVRLARRIAAAIRRWMERGDETGRPVAPGDVLVLVRKRGAFFEAVIRALKDAGVPVAGADRLTVAEHIGVRDLVAAGRAALLPRDDLTLAAALKSPLVGWDDEDLVRIAATREAGTPLVDALRLSAAAGDAAALRGLAALTQWRDLVVRKGSPAGPFGFYATLLGPCGARRALVSRLGAEAGDAIDAFLAQALDHERRFPPSLTGFLNAFEGATGDIKRDMDDTRDEVRVMTVHGAKGLEAPVVFLADGGEKPDGRHDPKLIEVEVVVDGETVAVPVWSPGEKHDPAPVAEARAVLRRKAAEENNRLLYVALTRARNRLIVASAINRAPPDEGGEGAPRPPAESWTGMVLNGLERAPEAAGAARLVRVAREEGGEVLRWLTPDKPLPARPPQAVWEASPHAAPDWLAAPVRPEAEPAPPLRPSSALAAADRPDRAAETPAAAARLHGRLVHALIERLPGLPAAARTGAAEGFVKARAARMPEAERARIVTAALDVLAAPALAALFGPESRAEVALAGNVELPDGRVLPVSGRIDRLALAEGEVHIADFKTGAPPPGGIRPSHVAQLALYGALLRQIMPAREVRAFLIHTAGPAVLEVPQARLDQALRRPGLAGGRDMAADGDPV